MCKTRCEYIPVRLTTAIPGFRQSYTCLLCPLPDTFVKQENIVQNFPEFNIHNKL